MITGDELNREIQKADGEIKALENTLVKLLESNDGYRNSYRKVSDQKSLDEEERLKSKLYLIVDQRKVKRAEENRLSQEVENCRSKYFSFSL